MKLSIRRPLVAGLAALVALSGAALGAQPASAAPAANRLGDLNVTLAAGASTANANFVTAATAATCPTGFNAYSKTWVDLDGQLIEITQTERAASAAKPGWGLKGDAINLTQADQLGGATALADWMFLDKDGVIEYIVSCGSSLASANPYADGVKFYSATLNVAADGTITKPGAPGMATKRLSGDDRYQTAVAVSKQADRVGRPLVLATGQNFADALAAGPLAAKLQGTLLLTTHGALPATVQAEIQRLKPSEIVVVGADSAVSETAAQAARTAAGGVKLTRIAGENRFDTAGQIATQYFAGSTEAFVVSGFGFPDAVSASSVASIGTPRPILLSPHGSVPAETTAAAKAAGITSFHIVGGLPTLSQTVESQLAAIGKVDRTAGNDRYSTNRMLMESFGPKTAEAVVIATGMAYPDALVSSVLSAKYGAPLILVPGNCMPKASDAYIKGLGAATRYVVGGEPSVQPSALTGICSF